jgi:hypothetical protein
MENNKNYVNLSWLVYIALGLIGFFLVRTFFDELNISVVYDLEMSIYIYDILIIVYGFFSCGLVYNLGKLIFSLACGYKLVYFNLFFMGAERINEKCKLFFGLKYDLSCKVVMEPVKENVKTTLPLLGGTITSVFALVLTYVLIFALDTTSTTKFFFLVSSMFYIFMIALSLVPCRMDNLNDGFTLFLLRNKKYKDVYLTNLKNIHAYYDSSKDYIYQDIEVENDPLVLDALLFNYYYLLKNKEVEKALELVSKIYEYKKNIISEDSLQQVMIGNAFKMCYQKEDQKLKEYYSKLDLVEKQVLNSSKKYEGVKTALYLYTYIDEDKEGYVKVVNDIDKLKKSFKNTQLLEVEEHLIKHVLKDVALNKPEWNE